MFEQGLDQAAGLRRLIAPPPLKLLALPMDAGGEGAWVAQVARTLQHEGHRPVVLDATCGAVANAFGLRARRDLVELLQGTAHFDEVAQVSTEGVCLLRADDGVEAFVASGAPSAQLFTSFARLSHGFDTLLLAMPAGELACMVSPTEASPLIALTRDGQGLIDAYAGVKSLVEFGFRRFFVAWHADVQAAAHRLSDVARARLGAELLPAGALPTDTVSLNSATFAQTLLGCAAQPLVLH